MNNNLIKEASEHLKIRDIYLYESSIKTASSFFPFVVSEGSLEVQYKNYVVESTTLTLDNDDQRDNAVVFKYLAALRMLPERTENEEGEVSEGEPDVRVEILATFAALYTVHGEISEEAIDEFALYNVGYHVWPYWREYAASSLQRLGMPPITLPLYRMPDSSRSGRTKRERKGR